MKWVLLLLVVAGAALAEETQNNEVVEEKEEGRLFLDTLLGLTAAKTTFLGVVSSGFSLAAQIVILIALIFLIVTLKSAKDGLGASGYGGYDYDYYHAPVYEHGGGGGYEHSSSGSSYASGYSKKRSADFPSFLNLPIVQRLTEKVHSALEQYAEQHQ